MMRRAVSCLLSLVAMTAATTALADRSLALPKLLIAEPAMPLSVSVLGAGFFLPNAILDLRSVHADPVTRARRDYSVMAALPTTHKASGAALPALETQTWKVSKSVMFTFPLAITGKNIVTAEFVGAGQLGLAPHGMAKGGVFTFTGRF